MTIKPRVSIVIPVYNRHETLNRAISSVLNQEFQEFEIIIVDDGSETPVSTIVDGHNDSRIRCMRFDENRGANRARNVGIEMSRSEYISFLDSDDELLPGNLSICAKVLDDSRDDCGGAYTSSLIIKDGKPYFVYSAKEKVHFSDLIKKNLIGSLSTTIFKKSAIEKAGFFDEELPAAQDYDLYLRIAEHYNIIGINEVLVNVHVDSRGRISENPEKKIRGFERIVEKHQNKLDDCRIADQLFDLGLIYAEKGDLAIAAKYFKEAIGKDRFHWNSYYHLTFTTFGKRFFNYSFSLKRNLRLILWKLGYS